MLDLKDKCDWGVFVIHPSNTRTLKHSIHFNTHLCHQRSHLQAQFLTDREVPLLYFFIYLIRQQEALSLSLPLSLSSETQSIKKTQHF